MVPRCIGEIRSKTQKGVGNAVDNAGVTPKLCPAEDVQSAELFREAGNEIPVLAIDGCWHLSSAC